MLFLLIATKNLFLELVSKMDISIDQLKDKKIVVYNAGYLTNPFGVKNLLFEKNPFNSEHTEITPYLYEECLKKGIQLLTPDIYLKFRNYIRNAILVRDDCISNDTEFLVSTGLRPAVLMVIEGPIYPVRFFYNLEKETSYFDHTFMAGGAMELVSRRTIFHPFVCPQSYTKNDIVPGSFYRVKYLSLISANKRIHKLKRLYSGIMNTIYPIPTFINTELYKERLKLIKYFSHDPAFDLYGRDWNKPVRYTLGRYSKSIEASFRGEVSSKFKILQSYKFNLSFENCIYKGYITEKIIDAMFAGSVPIYLGAPDISNYIPTGCFIDFRNFKNLKELDYYLKSMSENIYMNYVENIVKFLNSKDYYEKFSKEKHAEQLINIFESYF